MIEKTKEKRTFDSEFFLNKLEESSNSVKTGDNKPTMLYKKIDVIDKLFIQKESNNNIKNMHHINNDTGKTKHFTPAAQEWFNSIYSYNKNYIKLLPIADKNLEKLLKSYFNFFISSNIVNIKRLPYRYRKLSINKIFVGKGSLKHTSEKVVITSYIYNIEEMFLKSIVRNLAKVLYYTKKTLKKYVTIDPINLKEIVSYNRPFTLKEFLNLPIHSAMHKDVCFYIFWKEYKKLVGINKLREEENKEKLNKLKNNDKTFIYEGKFIDITKKNFFEAFSNDISLFKGNNYENILYPLLKFVENKGENIDKLSKFKDKVIIYKNFYDDFDKYISLAENNYKKYFYRFIYLFAINNSKYETLFISKFKHLLKSIYNKEIELNLVNLNKMHLNSDIFTQIVSLKLKNRKNNLETILSTSLNSVKLPNVSRITEKYYVNNRDEYLINKIRNKYINNMFDNNISSDSLNNLLSRFFSLTHNFKMETMNKSYRDIILSKYIIRSLKHLKLAGVRIEAKGRLTRRFTASRSLFKFKWKGGLKNVDASFKGLSTIMLRNSYKSNLQYSMLSSKNRNGAFGVKGWISNK